MKKIFTILLAMIMTFSLLACGSEETKNITTENTENTEIETDANEESKQENTVTSDAQVGDVLDKPEKSLEAEKFYVYFTYANDASETGMSTMEVALDDATDDKPDIVYISDGMLKTEESVYELDDDGNLTIYSKDVFMTTFVKDETSTAQQLAEAKEGVIQILYRLGYSFVEGNPNYKYEKCADEEQIFTGDAYVYNVLNDGEVVRKIWVDKETGIFVKMEMPDGTEEVVVQEINMDELGIPEYK